MLGFILLVALSSHLAPQLSRRDIFFGVTVSPDFPNRPVGRAIARRYAAEIWFLAFLAAAVVLSSPAPLVSGLLLMGQAIGASVAFVKARAAVRPHAVEPAAIREAELGLRPGLPGGLVGQLGPFLILLGAAVYVGLNWEDVPARFPTHWNLAGKPNGWIAKSVAGAFRGISIGFVACAMTLFTSCAVLHWTRLPRVTGPDGEQSRRVRRVNLIAMLASEYLVALLLAWTTVVSMFSDHSARLSLPLAFRVAPFALIIVGALVIGRMRRVVTSNGAPVGDTTPDSCWVLGRLYFNRADPALFVEKRMGLGYTLNLGNPMAWLAVIAVVVGLSVPLLLAP